ncbi:MAG: hypothetical protein ACREQ5_14895, partial [Candidatus Dormibacteria bacterium]
MSLATVAAGVSIIGGVSNILNGSGGGSAPQQQGSTSVSGQQGSNSLSLANLISLLGGASDLQNLFGSGSGSLTGETQTAAAAASPFASQYGQYQNRIPGVLNSALSSATPTSINPALLALSGITPSNSSVAGMAGNSNFAGALNSAAGEATINPAIASLAGSSNFLNPVMSAAGGATNNPTLEALSTPTAAQQFALRQGEASLNAGMAAAGTFGSGSQMLQLQNFGQQSGAQFEQQDFNNAATAQQLKNATQAQNFSQLASAAGMGISQQNQNLSQLLASNQQSNATQAQNFGQLSSAAGVN